MPTDTLREDCCPVQPQLGVVPGPRTDNIQITLYQEMFSAHASLDREASAILASHSLPHLRLQTQSLPSSLGRQHQNYLLNAPGAASGWTQIKH